MSQQADDIETYLDSRDAMSTCPECGAANSGNITCRTCRQVNREACQQYGWSTDFLDRMDELNPPTEKPVGAEEVKRFMEKFSND